VPGAERGAAVREVEDALVGACAVQEEIPRDPEVRMFEEIPNETNMEIGGIPAVSIYSPPSPMAPSYEEIYFIKNDILFRINMLDVDNEDNREFYDFMLPSFSFEK